MKVKMCGLRRQEDIIFANQVKPDYVGFVFAESKRKVTPETAIELCRQLTPEIQTVGVFVNEEPEKLAQIAEAVPLDVIQLHGDEEQEYIKRLQKLTNRQIWKAVRVQSKKDIATAGEFGADQILLDCFCKDAYGGTGKVIDMSLIENQEPVTSYFLAGGLTTENLEEMIKKINPYGIDISSGIETDGHKDLEKMIEVINICRRNL